MSFLSLYASYFVAAANDKMEKGEVEVGNEVMRGRAFVCDSDVSTEVSAGEFVDGEAGREKADFKDKAFILN